MQLRNPGRWPSCGPAATALGGPPVEAEDAMGRRLNAVIDRWVGQEKIVGVCALVARDGFVVYRRAAGFADREARIPVAEDSIFRLASMTKLIVSATALALIDEGRLSQDDPVSKWLPYFSPRLRDGRRPAITVRHLLTHTSGLTYGFLEPEGGIYRTAGVPQGLERTELSLEEALRRVAAVPLSFEPGAEWRYSVSTDVLGAVLEAASAMPLEAAVRRRVTQPLGMEDTRFRLSDPGRLTAAYRDGTDKAVRMDADCEVIPLGSGVPFSATRALDPNAYPSGGGGMTGTAMDYLRLLEAIRRGGDPILSPESAAALTRHAIGELRAWTEGEGWGFSLGAAVLLDPEAAQTPQRPGTWQWGGVLGGHWFVDPTERLTVVVLTNTSVSGVIGAFPSEIREAIYARN